jgi:hypothetical protein
MDHPLLSAESLENIFLSPADKLFVGQDLHKTESGVFGMSLDRLLSTCLPECMNE